MRALLYKSTHRKEIMKNRRYYLFLLYEFSGVRLFNKFMDMALTHFSMHMRILLICVRRLKHRLNRKNYCEVKVTKLIEIKYLFNDCSLFA